MTHSDNETRRLREAFAASSPEDVATGDCPRPETIWDAVRDELPRAESRAILQHVATCSLCTEAWRLAREIDEGDTTERLEGADEPSGSSYGRLAAAGAVAAMLAYFMVGVYVHNVPASGSVARYTESGALRLSGPKSLSRSNCRPTWSGLDGALYDIEISDGNLELIATATGLSIPALRIPEAELPTNGSLLLYIRAYSEADGTPLAERAIELECID